MTTPLILLAIPTVVLGLAIGFPPESGLIHHWLEPVFHEASEVLNLPHEPYQLFGIDGVLLLFGAGAGAIGVSLGTYFFGFRAAGIEVRPRQLLVEELSRRWATLYQASYAKWYVDEVYDAIFVRFGGLVARALWWFDARVIDGTVNGVAALTQGAGRGIRTIQTGRVQNYALGIATGLLVIAVAYLFVVAR